MGDSGCIKRRDVFLRACRSEYSRKFVLFARLRTADGASDTGRGPTWRPGETDEGSSPDDEGRVAANLPSGCAVHARYDYASCAGG